MHDVGWLDDLALVRSEDVFLAKSTFHIQH
jgi:hypothetical protein